VTKTHRILDLYCDGASRGNPGPAAYGFVLLHEGQVVSEFGKRIGNTTNNVAEYSGLVEGLKRALELGTKEIRIHADSELMIKQLKGEYKIKSPLLKPFFDQAKILLTKFESFKLQHVRREFNKQADQLCNEALDFT